MITDPIRVSRYGSQVIWRMTGSGGFAISGRAEGPMTVAIYLGPMALPQSAVSDLPEV